METECQLLRVGKAALAKWVKKIYSLQFSRILRLIYYPIQTKTSKIVIPTTLGAILEGTLNVNCFMVLGMMGACKMGQKNLVFPYSFRGCSSQFITQFEILKQANAFLMLLCRLVFLCPNQRLLLKTNEESATGLDLSFFVVVLLPTYLANFEAFFWSFL